MKKHFTITYYSSSLTGENTQIKVKGTKEQAQRFAFHYATQHHLPQNMIAIQEVA